MKLGKEGEVTASNPVAIADPKSGAIHFLYCVEYRHCFYMRSDDDGKTFSKPVEITSTFEKFRSEYNWKVFATGPGHGIRLRSGRLLVPVWLSLGTGAHGHRPSCVSVIYSDDGGRTWERGDIVVKHPEPLNPSETVAVELADGRVMFNIRNESEEGLRVVSTSPTGATDWSPSHFDPKLLEPVCMASIIRLTQHPPHRYNRILFANPHNTESRRKNLTIQLSYDEGQTWPVAKVLEAGLSGYSDMAVTPDGTIFCFYSRGDMSGDAFMGGTLCIAKFNLKWLTDGKDYLRETKARTVKD
jgi:sialidase-1